MVSGNVDLGNDNVEAEIIYCAEMVGFPAWSSISSLCAETCPCLLAWMLGCLDAWILE
jgi:hypothetical protein